MTMTPNAIQELNAILDSFKSGSISRENTVERIERLFQKEPVNYGRTMNQADQKFQEPGTPGPIQG